MEAETSTPPATDNHAWLTPGRFAIFLAAMILAAFPENALGLKTFFYRDFGVLGFPFVHYHHESFWRGELPLWNPYSNCGAPFLAQWGTMTLYPFSLFYCLLPLPWSLNFFCLAHLFVAGLGTFFLVRRWTGDPFAAAFAGFVFVFNGATLSSLSWPNYTVALGWLPWVIWLVERAWLEGGRILIAAVLVAALQMLSGVPEITLLTWLFVPALFFATTFRQAHFGKYFIRLSGIVVVVAGLTAVQILPFWDFLQHSQRDSHFASPKWSMPGWGWANFLVPLFHYFESSQGPFFQWSQEFLPSYYLGLGLLLLTCLGAFVGKTTRDRLLGVTLLFTLIFALGENGFLYPAIRRALPAIGVGRYPIKTVFFTAFLAAMLGAVAVAQLRQSDPAQNRRVRTKLIWLVAGMVLAIAGLLWFASAFPFFYDQWDVTFKNSMVRIFLLGLFVVLLVATGQSARSRIRFLAGIGLLLVVWIDIRTHLPSQNPIAEPVLLRPGFWAALVKSEAPRFGESRIFISRPAEEKLLYSTIPDTKKDCFAKRVAEWSNLNLMDGIPKVKGSSPLQLRPQAEVQSRLYNDSGDFTGLLDFLGVSYDYEVANAEMKWTRRVRPLPLITAGQAPHFAEGAAALKFLQQPEFDGRKIVVLPEAIKRTDSPAQSAHAKILSTQIATHRIMAEIETDQRTFAVIAQSYFHNWRAKVDDQPVALLPANHAFQAVEIPAGRHRLEVTYRDHYFYAGALISVLSVLVCAGAWLRWRKLARAAPRTG